MFDFLSYVPIYMIFKRTKAKKKKKVSKRGNKEEEKIRVEKNNMKSEVILDPVHIIAKDRLKIGF